MEALAIKCSHNSGAVQCSKVGGVSTCSGIQAMGGNMAVTRLWPHSGEGQLLVDP